MAEKIKSLKEEIEIDVDADIPLSKKELRLIKKGKITLEELQAQKAKANESEEPKESSKSDEKKEETKGEGESQGDAEGETKKESTRSKHAVWIGNLSFTTTTEELSNFIIVKSSIKESDITRIKMPHNGRKNRGFAYVDLLNAEQVNTVLELNEENLNGRNLLIKSADNYIGRPEKSSESKDGGKPPSRILFVGNLGFETTKEGLEKHFQHCGEIVRVRMATFEDSGKCKGFAFLDFKNEEGSTAALKDKSCWKYEGRRLRMEYGEDRSGRKVNKKRTSFEMESASANTNDTPVEVENTQKERKSGFQQKQQKVRRIEHRTKSSVALAKAHRESAAIVESKGKKITFN